MYKEGAVNTKGDVVDTKGDVVDTKGDEKKAEFESNNFNESSYLELINKKIKCKLNKDEKEEKQKLEEEKQKLEEEKQKLEEEK